MSATSINAIRHALSPELRRYFWDNGSLHHPLITEVILNFDEVKRANERFLRKREQLKQLRTDLGDGRQYVFLHERPYRVGALQRIGPRLEPSYYWKLVREVWMDSENIRQHFAGWKRVWSVHRPHKQECLTPEEQARLESMPALFSVWRGVGFRGRIQGLSWTVDRDKAVWFAQRFDQGRGKLIHGEVRRRDVHGFFQERDESRLSLPRSGY